MYFEFTDEKGNTKLTKVNIFKGVIMRILNYDFYTYVPKSKIIFK